MRDKVVLIDPDKDALAHMLRVLAATGFHVQPYERLAEFLLYREASDTAVLVADDRLDALVVRRRLMEFGEWLAIIAFGQEPSPQRIAEFVKGGGYDYLALPIDAALLKRSLAQLDKGQADYASARRRAACARIRLGRLSPREAEVLACMADGHSNKAIGIGLGISPRTVEIHRANMLAKLDASSSAEALRMFFEDTLLNCEVAAAAK
ncbi:response regulator transcription factor [Alteriqipengyuania sp. 357]